MRTALKVLMAALVFVALAVPGLAEGDPAGATVSGETNAGEYPAPSAGNTSVEAGNISNADLDANQSTLRWAGLMGDITGNIVLGDSDEDVLFTWTALGRLVYASEDAAVTWSELVDATVADMDAHVTGATDSDNYTETFVGASEAIDSDIFSLSSDFATTLSGAATTWKTYSLKDGSDNVFVGDVEEDGSAYDSSTVDYQMILPEDGTDGDTTATTYYLWVELI